MEGGGRKGQGRIFFLEFDTFFYFEFKNTSNLIFLDFKVPSSVFETVPIGCGWRVVGWETVSLERVIGRTWFWYIFFLSILWGYIFREVVEIIQYLFQFIDFGFLGPE